MIAQAALAGVMVLLAAAAALFVLAPLRRPPSAPAEHDAESERLAVERWRAALALRDLELDRATGKLSDAEYADLAARYRTRALGVLRRLDALRSGGGGGEAG